MKTSEFIESFTSKDEKNVILRVLRWEDLDDLVEFTNSLVQEGADIARNNKITREEEADWLRQKFVEIEKGNVVDVVAEVNGKLVANSFVIKQTGYSNHVGNLCMAILNNYRNVGIGTEMLKTLISQAEKMGLKMLTLRVFSTNKRAIHVYEKAGFKETGRIPNEIYKNRKYADHIIMVKQLTDLS
jgi:RimJ/RimL family protein N-acetyltransferase